jgi:peptidoglycan/LPS O-acetylase OafA/YrhL
VLVAGEPLTSRLATGGLMILGGALISEVVWSDRTARLVSRFLAPHYVLGLCWLLLALMGSGTWREGIRWTGLIIVPCMLALLAVFGLALRRGTISDWHISSRQERMAPLLIGPSIVLSALPAVLFYRMDAPPVLLAAALATFALVLVNLAITSFWKISQHASSVALGTTLLAASLGAGAAPALLLIPLVGWARVKLGAHTVGQTVAGCVTGALIPVVALRLLGVG